MIKNFVKRYRFFLILLVINISLLFISPEIGKKSFSITYDNLLEMLGVIPPIFILLGVLLSFIIGATAAGHFMQPFQWQVYF